MQAKDREDLARGVMRRWSDGDTPQTIAARIHRPQRRVWEAIEPDLRRVQSMFVKGSTADDIARDLTLPRAFVISAMRIVAARRARTR